MKLELFCDGGVIGHNPSEIGGTWAFRNVVDGVPEFSKSGVITPSEAELPAITNNLTEMLALVHGLESLPANWDGTVYSDSQITLGRAFLGWKWKNIPPWLFCRFGASVARLIHWPFRWVLLEGHPTKANLIAGFGGKGFPVSEHNVWCDKACGERAKEFMLDYSAR